MKVVHSLFEITDSSFNQPLIGLTIGNFDGVHLGHRQLLRKIKKECVERNFQFVVITFVPHPHKILYPDKDRFLISSYNQRRALLEEIGVDVLVEFNFTRDFSTLTARQFLTKYLLAYPAVKKFYLGYDFAFGANKQGGFDEVQELCKPLGIEVEIQPKFEFEHSLVSSSLIRDKLLVGNIKAVNKLLERPFHLEGVVIKGEGRGKKIGFPTANIQVSSDLIVPHKGVYVTRTLYKGMVYKSVTNIGNNPTFKDTSHIHIETNLFDFDSDIYGEFLDIQFLEKIRDEKKFTTVNDLIEQIRTDIIFARNFLEDQ
jgi:riboflavin kinase / FMN adenylyltransferase